MSGGATPADAERVFRRQVEAGTSEVCAMFEIAGDTMSRAFMAA